MNTQNSNNSNGTRKILASEASKIIAVATVIVTVLSFVFQMKQDIALIKQKITTIEEKGFSHITKSMDEMNVINANQNKDIKEISEKLNQHLQDFNSHKQK